MELGSVEWFIVLLVLLGTVVWIWALVDCLIHEPAQGTTKLIWVIVILFTNIMAPSSMCCYVARNARGRPVRSPLPARPYAEAWDTQAQPIEDEVIADYHDTKRRAQEWLEGYRHGLGLDL